MSKFTLVVSGIVEVRAKTIGQAMRKLEKMTHDVSFQYDVNDLKRIGIELQVVKAYKDGMDTHVPMLKVRIK